MKRRVIIELEDEERELLRRYMEKVGGNEEEAAVGVTMDESSVAESFYSFIE